MPAAMGLVVLALPASRSVVGRSGSALVAAALGGFALSLVPFSVFQLLTRTSYAFQDTRTPALVNIALNVVTVLWGVAAIVSFDSGFARLRGLALGDAASYAVGCLLLRRRLHARGTIGARGLLGASFGRSLVATAAMGLLLALVLRLVGIPESQVSAMVTTLLMAVLGIATYVALCRVLKVQELKALSSGGRAHRRRSGSAG